MKQMSAKHRTIGDTHTHTYTSHKLRTRYTTAVCRNVASQLPFAVDRARKMLLLFIQKYKTRHACCLFSVYVCYQFVCCSYSQRGEQQSTTIGLSKKNRGRSNRNEVFCRVSDLIESTQCFVAYSADDISCATNQIVAIYDFVRCSHREW